MIGLVLALSATEAAARQSTAMPAPEDQAATTVDRIVVTGSLIRGTPENAALPVDVVSAEELSKQGAPSMVDLIKSIPAMQGVLGESNQFGSAQTSGSGNVNLRGLGPARTLVLMNGRRLATSPQGIYVDTNLLPIAAIGRIEVLKDGAAATYGSDAIGGVVNFITRRDLKGLELQGSYQAIPGSDGETTLAVNYGWVGDNGNLLLSAGYRRRSELSTLERDFAIQGYDRNPGGGWTSFGNPGVYATSPLLSAASRFADPSCAALGSELRVSNGAPTCYFQYSRFDNLVEDQDDYQFYAETNLDLNDNVTFHAELSYASHDVPRENSSPSYGSVQNPPDSINGPAPANQFYIPLTNPGLSALLPQLTPAQQAAVTTAGGVYTLGLFFRPYGAGGNPLTGEGKEDRRFFDGLRFSAGLKGVFGNGFGWDVAATHMVSRADIRTPDIVLSRLQYALRGLGGESCNPVTGTPGVGSCQYFNPFSTGVASNAASGEINPNYVAGSPAALANNAEMAKWLFVDNAFQAQTTLTVFDAVLDGETPLNLPGGPVAFAVGGQYRYNAFSRDVSKLSNSLVSPCPIENDTTCTTATGRGNGPLTFFGPLTEQDFDTTAYAAFAEIQAPITSSLQLQLAGRYENFGGNVGSTFNPKAALRWQIVPALALRGSVGSTFRAPPQSQLLPDPTTTLVYRAEASGYRPTDTFGNPNLKPETAKTINVGAVFEIGGLNATLDYWNFDFSDPITTEPAGNMLSTLIAGGCNFNAAFLARFTPTNGVPFGPGACTGSNLARVRSTNINGAYVKTSGVDLAANYRFRDVLGGDLRLGVDASYTLEYKVGEQVVEGVKVRNALDLNGTLGQGPDLRGNAYVDFNRDQHNLRLTVRYIGEQLDTRNGEFGAGNIFTATSPDGRVVKAFVTVDLAYRVELPWQTTATLLGSNILDEAPPFARYDLNYDQATANPLGRTFKLNFRKKF